MPITDKDDIPLIKWNDSESAFEAWKECTRGRFCDYTGLSYAKLTGGSGIQWPCNEQSPEGADHLYTDGVFNTAPDYCETFGQDFDTGASISEEEYRANDPKGRALIKASDYLPPHEQPDDQYPLMLTTGIVYHFHTRTKTGRSQALHDAAPDAFVQISPEDAQHYSIAEGDLVEVVSRRGRVVEPVRLGNIEPGLVFIPFHYGYWDKADRPRALK